MSILGCFTEFCSVVIILPRLGVAKAKEAPWEHVVGSKTARISSPSKVYFPECGVTKGILGDYFVSVASGIMGSVGKRPVALHRFIGGLVGKKRFFQKRVPKARPDWLTSVAVAFPSANPGELLCPQDVADVLWAVNLGAFELHPWPVTTADLDHPDELRVDFDPCVGAPEGALLEAVQQARARLIEHGLEAFPKLSGSRGIHLHVPIRRDWSFVEVRHACVGLARQLEADLPDLVTAAWWKEERGPRIFVDFNQNLRDKTIAAAYSVRPLPHAPVACPVTWDELPDANTHDLTVLTVPKRFEQIGDPFVALRDATPGSIASLLELYRRQLADGRQDAPWPPHYPKQPGEPPRVQPSKARKS